MKLVLNRARNQLIANIPPQFDVSAPKKLLKSNRARKLSARVQLGALFSGLPCPRQRWRGSIET